MPHPLFAYSIPHSFAKINMKLYRMIFIVLTIVILYDGFNEKLINPTIFDLMKWVAYFSYTFTVKRL